jgi:hypothetical protein
VSGASRASQLPGGVASRRAAIHLATAALGKRHSHARLRGLHPHRQTRGARARGLPGTPSGSGGSAVWWSNGAGGAGQVRARKVANSLPEPGAGATRVSGDKLHRRFQFWSDQPLYLVEGMMRNRPKTWQQRANAGAMAALAICALVTLPRAESSFTSGDSTVVVAPPSGRGKQSLPPDTLKACPPGITSARQSAPDTLRDTKPPARTTNTPQSEQE